MPTGLIGRRTCIWYIFGDGDGGAVHHARLRYPCNHICLKGGDDDDEREDPLVILDNKDKGIIHFF